MFTCCLLPYTVLPTPPSGPTFVTVNNTLTRVSWTLTNTSADAVPDDLRMTITNHPDSPVSLSPTAKQFLLQTEPGMNYTVTLTAENQDGLSRSPASLLSIVPTGKNVLSCYQLFCLQRRWLLTVALYVM